MDYRRFLNKEETLVLPWSGGARVDAPGRSLRITRPPDGGRHGWYRFSVKGRQATPLEPVDPPAEFAHRPAVRGHFLDGQLVVDGARKAFLELLPDDEEPARFAPILARRWHGDGALLFDRVEFESGVEDEVRDRLASGDGLANVKHAPATLRAAFGFALVSEVSRTVGIPASWAEARRFVASVAERGAKAAEEGLRALAAERELAAREWAVLQQRRQEQELRDAVSAERERRLEQARRNAREAEERAQQALESAGARVTGVRRLGDAQLEVSFTFLGERFTAIADAATLQVIDSGICLGHPPRDDLVTLDSLPSVLKEAIDEEKLVRLR